MNILAGMSPEFFSLGTLVLLSANGIFVKESLAQ